MSRSEAEAAAARRGRSVGGGRAAHAGAPGVAYHRLAHMPHLSIPRALRRPRTLAGLALLLVLAIVVVVSNQGGSPAVRTASAQAHDGVPATDGTSPADGVGGVTASPTAPPIPSGLHVLQASYRFRDDSARHPGVPALSAAGGILLDVTGDRILWDNGAHLPRPPASTTKVFSSLVALENFDLQRRVDVTPDALFTAADETRLGIEAGDHYTVLELLQAMMTISANDAADVLAADTVGLPRYVAAMNEQVQALGLSDSHFTSPVGLDDPLQRASAYDLAVAGLAEYDAFPALRDIVGQKQIDVPATTGHIAYTLHNLDRLLQIYPPARGIKPGWTGDAGYCLVALAERDGHRLVAVLMDDPHLYNDTRLLFEWGFGELGIPPLPTPTPSPSPTPHR